MIEPAPREPFKWGWIISPSREPGRAVLLVVELAGIVIAIAIGLVVLFLFALGCYSLVAISP